MAKSGQKAEIRASLSVIRRGERDSMLPDGDQLGPSLCDAASGDDLTPKGAYWRRVGSKWAQVLEISAIMRLLQLQSLFLEMCRQAFFLLGLPKKRRKL